MAYRSQIVGDFRRTPCVIFGRGVQFSRRHIALNRPPRGPEIFPTI